MTFAHDEHGRLKVLEVDDFRHAANPYDPLIENQDGALTTKTFFDARGLVTKTRNDRGGETLFAYDGLGRKVESRLPKVVDPLPPPGGGGLIDSEVATAEYDKAGNVKLVTRVETAPGGGTTSLTSSATYDAQGRILTRTNGTGADASTVELQYDARGNLRRAENPMGAETLLEYDAYDRVVKSLAYLRKPDETLDFHPEFNPDGIITAQRQFDKDGLVLNSTDDRGMVTTSTYDGVGRALTTSLPDGTGRVNAYSPEGSVLTTDVLSGSTPVLRYTQVFDSLNRLEQRTGVVLQSSLAGNILGPSTQDFQYDGQGRITWTRDDTAGLRGIAEVRRTYDSLGRVLEEKQIRTLGQNPPVEVSVASTFDNDGFRRTLQHASLQGSPDREETFTPDALGRISEISAPETLTTKYQYRGAGRRLGLTRFRGRFLVTV